MELFQALLPKNWAELLKSSPFEARLEAGALLGVEEDLWLASSLVPAEIHGDAEFYADDEHGIDDDGGQQMKSKSSQCYDDLILLLVGCVSFNASF